MESTDPLTAYYGHPGEDLLIFPTVLSSLSRDWNDCIDHISCKAPPVFDIPPPPAPPAVSSGADCISGPAEGMCDMRMKSSFLDLEGKTGYGVVVSSLLLISVVIAILAVTVLFVFVRRRRKRKSDTRRFQSDTDVHSGSSPDMVGGMDKKHFFTARSSMSSASASSSIRTNPQHKPYLSAADHFGGSFRFMPSERVAENITNFLTPQHRPSLMHLTANRPVPSSPHIIIGGQPFYLIPTSAATAADLNPGMPFYSNNEVSRQHSEPAPIYEEIVDSETRSNYYANPASVFGGTTSDYSSAAASDVTRLPQFLPMSNSCRSTPRHMGRGFASPCIREDVLNYDDGVDFLTTSLDDDFPPQKRSPRAGYNSDQRSSPRVRVAQASPSIGGKTGGVYYYGDTLHKKARRNGGVASSSQKNAFRLSDDSDSGISGNGQSPVISGNVGSAPTTDTEVVLIEIRKKSALAVL